MKAVAVLGLALALAPRLAHAEGGAPVVSSPSLAFGEWNERVELDLPPAARDVRPKIALVASHHSVDTEVGSGWRLDAGVSVIRRRSSANGVPEITGDMSQSSFYVDGTELVLVGAPSGSHYQPETYDGSRFDFNTTTNTWTRKRDGWTFTYGGTNANRSIDLAAAECGRGSACIRCER